MTPEVTSPKRRFETFPSVPLPALGHGGRCSEFRQAQGLRLCPGAGVGGGLLGSGGLYHLRMPSRLASSHSRVGAGGREAGQRPRALLTWSVEPAAGSGGPSAPPAPAPLLWRARCCGQLEGWPAWHAVCLGRGCVHFNNFISASHTVLGLLPPFPPSPLTWLLLSARILLIGFSPEL